MVQHNTHGEVGRSVLRKESWNKVSGAVKYNNDAVGSQYLHARLVTSRKAHARILNIHTSEAEAVTGVRAVITGKDTEVLCGEVLEDRPPLARGKVRYYGEPVAIVVADTEGAAVRGARAVAVDYDPLPVVNTPRGAVEDGAPLVHRGLASYKVVQLPCYPDPGTNIADRAHIRKGDPGQGWAGSDVTVSLEFTLPQVDHGAMETQHRWYIPQ